MKNFNYNVLLLLIGLGFLVACTSSSDPVPVAKKTYKVTFDGNKPSGATADVTGVPAVQVITEGNAAKAPTGTPTLAGYTFDGWYTTAAGTTAFAFTTKIKAITTIYAKWTAKPTFTVTYNVNKPTGATDEVMGVPTSETVVIGGKAVAPTVAPTLTGYLFAGWYTATDGVTEFDFTVVEITADTEVFAKWTQTFTVTYNGNKPSTAPAEASITGLPDPNPIQINKDAMVVMPTTNPTLPGYRFAGWYDEDTGTTKHNFSTPVTDHLTIYASWVLASGAVTAVAITSDTNATIGTDLLLTAVVTGGTDGGVTWAFEPATAPMGVTIEGNVLKTVLAASTDKTDVTVKATSIDTDGSTPAVNLSATAVIRLRLPQYEIRYDGNKPGDAPRTANVENTPSLTVIDWGGVNQMPDTNPTLTGYRFLGWYDEAAATTEHDFVPPVTASTTLYARWVLASGAVTSVEITSTGDATKGVDYPLTARVIGGMSGTVVWTLKTTVTDVTIGGTNNDMLVTTAAVTETSVTVVATSTDDGATATEKVIAEKVININPALLITSSGSAVVGRPLSLTATVDGTAPTTGLAWTIDGTAPTGVTIGGTNNDMLMIDGSSAQEGMVTVVATFTVPSTDPVRTVMKKQDITVRKLTGLTIARTGTMTTPLEIPADSYITLSTTFTVTAEPTGVDVGTLTWTAPAASATEAGGTVAGDVFTAGSILGDVTLTVTTDVAVTPAISATIVVKVVHAPLVSLTLTRKADQTETKAILNTAIDLTSVFDVGSDPANADKSVTWSVSTPNGSTATGTVETGTSMLTATALGDLTVIVTSTVDTTKTSALTITVVRPDLVSLSLTRKAGMDSTTAIIGTDLELATVFDVGSEPADADKSVAWSVSTPAGSTAAGTVASGTSMLSSLLTATAPGELTVTVTSTVDTTKTSALTIMVVRPDLVSLSLTRKTGQDMTTAVVNTAIDLASIFDVGSNPADADKSVTWSVSAAADSTAAGNVMGTSLTATAPGDLTVTVTSTVDITKAITETITVVRPDLVSLSLTRKTGQDMTTAVVNTAIDLTTVFDVGSNPADADKSVTWSVSAAAGSTAAGNVMGTSLTATAPGDLTVTVTSTVDITKAITETITVVRPTLIGLTLTRKMGQTATTAVVNTAIDLTTVFDVGSNPADADKSVTWSVSAAAGSTAAGNVMGTSLTATAPGDLTVTVTSTVDITKAITETITVVRPTLIGLTLTRKMGQTATTATVNTAIDLASVFDVGSNPADADKSVTWSVSAAAGSTAAGNVMGTSLTATAPGMLTVTVTSTADTTKTTTETIMVVRPTLIGLTLTRKMGQTATTAVVNTAIDLATVFDVGSNPADADKSVTWSVSASTGSTAAGTVASGTSMLTATAPGMLTVTVTSTADTTKTTTETIMVVRPTLIGLTLTRKMGQTATTAVVNTAIDLASIFDVGSNPTDADKSVTWSVSASTGSTAAGTVASGTSMLTATAPGMLTVTVTSTADTTKTTTETIMVVRPAATGVTIDDIPTTTTPTIGTPLQLSATVAPAGSEPTVTWALQGAFNGYTIDADTGVLTSDTAVSQPGNVVVIATSGTGASAIASAEKAITFEAAP